MKLFSDEVCEVEWFCFRSIRFYFIKDGGFEEDINIGKRIDG